ncbi:MAG: Ldh family oxidoreductase [Bryobacteraceae bacterium]
MAEFARYSHDALLTFTASLFTSAGASSATAALMAESIVAAGLRGVDSHAFQLLPFYLAQCLDRRVDAAGEGKVASESGATLVYDGCNALGQIVSDRATSHAVRLAQEHGLGLVVAHDSNHFGAAAFWAERISRHGMIGIVLCNASSIVAPWQSRKPVWGTNPICVSVPGDPAANWLLDMATTTVAMGKIYRAAFEKKPNIPAGWAMDASGAPTTSTDAALKGGMLMPLGGYKGSGLAMMVEILCGVLSGGAIGTELGGLRVGERPFRVSQFFLAIDIVRFVPLDFFRARLGELIAMVKEGPAAPGCEDVLVAGDPEWRTEADRRKHGIPISAPLWTELAALAGRLGVVLPGALPPLS